MPYCYAIFLPPPSPPPSTAPRLRAREINVRPVCTPISLDRAPPIISANCLSDSNAELISRIHTPRTGRGNNRLDPIVRRVEACKSNQKLLLGKKDRYRRLTQYLADRGCSNSIWRARDNVSPRRRKIKRLIGRDVWIFGIGGRFERGDDGWSKRGLNAWRTYASTGSRGAYLSILRGSICVVRQTGNTGGNYHPDPKCSRTSPRVGRGWKADRANWQSRSRACTCPVAAM